MTRTRNTVSNILWGTGWVIFAAFLILCADGLSYFIDGISCRWLPPSSWAIIQPGPVGSILPHIGSCRPKDSGAGMAIMRGPIITRSALYRWTEGGREIAMMDNAGNIQVKNLADAKRTIFIMASFYWKLQQDFRRYRNGDTQERFGLELHDPAPDQNPTVQQ